MDYTTKELHAQVFVKKFLEKIGLITHIKEIMSDVDNSHL